MTRGTVATTATLAGFRREDISFHDARKQSEIVNELSSEQCEVKEVEVPVSTTPEQVISYFKECIANSEGDRNKQHLYSQTIKYINRMLELEQKVVKYKTKELAESHTVNLEAVEVEDE